jgi:hypothetical protein
MLLMLPHIYSEMMARRATDEMSSRWTYSLGQRQLSLGYDDMIRDGKSSRSTIYSWKCEMSTN